MQPMTFCMDLVHSIVKGCGFVLSYSHVEDTDVTYDLLYGFCSFYS